MKCFFVPVIVGAMVIVTKDKKSGNSTRKAFSIFFTKNSGMQDIAHNKRSVTV
jgi:hypothetical protein